MDPDNKSPQRPTWMDNVEVTHTESIRAVRTGQLSFHDLMMIMSEHIKVFRLDAFEFNGTIHSVHDIYPPDKEYMCIFGIEKETRLKLMTLGSKTLSELSAVGYNRENRSLVPLLFYRNSVDGKFNLTSINLL
jgi:hypothetical protein